MNTLKAEIVVPEWVNWIAVDGLGEVRGFKSKPTHSKWHSMWSVANQNECSITLYTGKLPKNWKDELYEWK